MSRDTSRTTPVQARLGWFVKAETVSEATPNDVDFLLQSRLGLTNLRDLLFRDLCDVFFRLISELLRLFCGECGEVGEDGI